MGSTTARTSVPEDREVRPGVIEVVVAERLFRLDLTEFAVPTV